MSEAVLAGPIAIEVEEGKKYFWCACGKTGREPFCDGAHKGTGIGAKAFTAEAAGQVHLCGCKKTKTPPFCDGSHL